LLKKVVQQPTETVLPPELEINDVDCVIPEKIVATRNMVDRDGTKLQWLIQWKGGQSSEEATWEDAVTIKSQFPDLNLEDKISFEGGSNDENEEVLVDLGPSSRVFQVYSRRAKEATHARG